MKSALIFLFLALSAARLQAQTYTVTDLGTLGGISSSASKINASGIVVGGANLPNGNFHATHFSGTGLIGSNTDLGTMGGPGSIANDINASGTIVGNARSSTYSNNLAVRFGSSGTSSNTDLGTLGGTVGSANAINDAGTIVGESSLVNNSSTHATLFLATGNIDLGTLGGPFSQASAINADGTIVGYGDTALGSRHAILFGNSGTDSNTDLGTLGGDTSNALAINDLGTIVGYSQILRSFNSHATLFRSSGNVDLGTLGGDYSYASGINASGDIVGYSATTSGTQHAFIYRDGTMQDLNTLIPADSGIVVNRASTINNAGQIAASGLGVDGLYHALRLDPSGSPITPIPPVTFLITAKASSKSKGTIRGGRSYRLGTRATLVATPKTHHVFLYWKEGRKIVSKRKTYTFTVTKARTVVAFFK